MVVPPVLSNQNQQMDEAVINGANLFYAPQFHIDPNSGNKSQNQWLLGLVNSAPYVCTRYINPFDTSLLTFLGAVLCHPWLLAHRPSQQTSGSAGHHLRLRSFLVPYLHLAKCYQFMASSFCCSLCPWVRRRSQVLHSPRLCS